MAKHVIDQPQNTSWYIDESNDTWILTKGTTLSASMSNGISDSQSQHDNTIIIECKGAHIAFIGNNVDKVIAVL